MMSIDGETDEFPDYCQTVSFTDAHGVVKRLVFPKALDLDRPKRARTTFSIQQLDRLEEAFQSSQYMVGKDRMQLAQKLGLSETQVKVWFQNRRTKHKKDRDKKCQATDASAESIATKSVLKILEFQSSPKQFTSLPVMAAKKSPELSAHQDKIKMAATAPSPPFQSKWNANSTNQHHNHNHNRHHNIIPKQYQLDIPPLVKPRPPSHFLFPVTGSESRIPHVFPPNRHHLSHLPSIPVGVDSTMRSPVPVTLNNKFNQHILHHGEDVMNSHLHPAACHFNHTPYLPTHSSRHHPTSPLHPFSLP